MGNIHYPPSTIHHAQSLYRGARILIDNCAVFLHIGRRFIQMPQLSSQIRRGVRNRVPIRSGEIPFVEILGVRVHSLTRHAFLDRFSDLLEENVRGWLSYINPHTVNVASELPWFRDHINRSLISWCDGVGVTLGASILNRPLPGRFTLPDCFDEICEILASQRSSVFFLGGSDEVIKEAVARTRKTHPALDICGYASGYFPISDGIDVHTAITRAKPDVVFVGMGMPRQEEWIHRNAGSLPARILIPAGGLFELLSGRRRRCPPSVSQLGLEWLHRLIQEPDRLWRRYILGNPEFLWRVIARRFQ